MSTKPTLIAYTVRNRAKGQKAIWTRIGAAWPHATGSGISVELEAYPVDGRLVLIEPKASEAADAAEAADASEEPVEA